MDCLSRQQDPNGKEGFFSKFFSEREKDVGAIQSKITKDLASKLDVDVLGSSFARFAGADEKMDREEYARFTKETNITRQQAASLWNILDRDHSGMVDVKEFYEALSNLQQARAWLRYCPDCVYRNTCAYCQECNVDCDDCTDESFCASHWEDHPARSNPDAGDEANGQHHSAFPVGSQEWAREALLIRPLAWAYHSPATAWVPVAQKAKLRQVLRDQQLKSAEAAKIADAEEQAALTRLGIGER